MQMDCSSSQHGPLGAASLQLLSIKTRWGRGCCSVWRSGMWLRSLREIANQRCETRKSVARVHIVFDHVEPKIVKTAETPNSQHQEGHYFPGGICENQERR